ncbi:MAG: hypothetical protein NZ932_00740 [Candidatus Bathyarchaeota archaeon]|nr:hypothetical protein [Candidatus Bathyarchaeota archaeon]
MVHFVVEKGRKSEGDFVIRVYSYGEVWSLEHVLRLLKIIFDSEKRNYPIEKGFRGSAYLLNAITEIAFGRDVELVLADYRLKRKSGSKVHIIERLDSDKTVQKLHEVLE